VDLSTTSGAHALLSQTVQQPASSQSRSNISDTVDLEDEYLCNDSENLMTDKIKFLTQDYFEYESGQKEIIVRGRLRQNLNFWKSITTNNFVIDTILQGYKISFFSKPEPCHLPNNKSALENKAFVIQAIQELLDRGLIEICEEIPFIVNPLTVSVRSNDKRRLILDLRAVNKHLWKQYFKYDDIKIALEFLKKGSWMIKFDIHSAYHFIEIFPPHTTFLGFSWTNLQGVSTFYKFLVLPFDLSTSAYVFSKVFRP
jgi:hypothetical protein